MRRVAKQIAAAAIACALLVAGGATRGANNPATRANEMAYNTAIKCFVAYGTARGNSHDVGDLRQASAYEASARSAYDVAERLADILGYPKSKVDQDFALAQAQELPRFVQDRTYLARTITTCGLAGL